MRLSESLTETFAKAKSLIHVHEMEHAPPKGSIADVDWVPRLRMIPKIHLADLVYYIPGESEWPNIRARLCNTR